jgi:hypothetical protein
MHTKYHPCAPRFIVFIFQIYDLQCDPVFKFAVEQFDALPGDGSGKVIGVLIALHHQFAGSFPASTTGKTSQANV